MELTGISGTPTTGVVLKPTPARGGCEPGLIARHRSGACRRVRWPARYRGRESPSRSYVAHPQDNIGAECAFDFPVWPGRFSLYRCHRVGGLAETPAPSPEGLVTDALGGAEFPGVSTPMTASYHGCPAIVHGYRRAPAGVGGVDCAMPFSMGVSSINCCRNYRPQIIGEQMRIVDT